MMTQAALVALRHDNRMVDVYERAHKSYPHQAALTHIANKMATIIWHTSQDRTLYDQRKEARYARLLRCRVPVQNATVSPVSTLVGECCHRHAPQHQFTSCRRVGRVVVAGTGRPKKIRPATLPPPPEPGTHAVAGTGHPKKIRPATTR